MTEDKETELEDSTTAYLRCLQDARLPSSRFQIWKNQYIGEDSEDGLLARHMEYAENDGRLPDPASRGGTLVLLVGHSVEPLLQSIWAHEPERLVLILAPLYYVPARDPDAEWDGEKYHEELDILFEALPPEKRRWRDGKDEDGTPRLVTKHLEAMTPTAVFQALLECVRTRKDVIIDITGAKKSMAAGAFLYAAYADVAVAYVDYDDRAYRLDFKAPYGYLCLIRHFSSPYQDFALRDWEQVQQLYQRRHFREARQLLLDEESGIIAAMTGHLPGQAEAYFSDEQAAMAETLAEILEVYELWDASDFHGAWEKARQLAEHRQINLTPLPSAVETFAADWPWAGEEATASAAADQLLSMHKDLTQNYPPWEDPRPTHPERSIFAQPRRVVIYAEDEVARIERLIRWNEDYRSALLRAAGLNETLLKARMIALALSDEYSGLAFEKIIGSARASAMWRKLTGTAFGKRNDPWKRVSLDPADHMDTFWDPCALDLDTLTNLRNKTIHTYLPVPRSLAVEALHVARCNLDEYERGWVAHAGEAIPDVVTRPLPWRKVCRLCGADQFLPPNLLDEEEPDERTISC